VRDQEIISSLQQLSTRLQVQPPLLLSHAKVQAPFLSGFLRPAIVLPANYAATLDASIMRAILLHELAHLSRRDCWWKLLAGTVCAVLWVQPLLWVLCRRLEQASESWCDEVVVSGGCAPHNYAEFLLELSERLVSKPVEHAAGVGMIPFRSNLGQRIQRIMESSRDGILPVSRPTRIAIVAGMMGALTAVLVLVAVEAAPQPSVGKQSSAASVVSPTSKPTQSPSIPLSRRGKAVITGRVLYENGRPASGVGVTAAMPTREQQRLRGSPNFFDHPGWHASASPAQKQEARNIGKKWLRLQWTSVKTAQDGSYRLTGLTSASYIVFAPRATGWAGASISSVTAREKGSVRAPDLILTRGAIIQGKITDKLTGKPLPGVYIGNHGPHSPFDVAPVFTQTDKRGHYRMRVAAGRNIVWLAGPQVKIQQEWVNLTPAQRSSRIVSYDQIFIGENAPAKKLSALRIGKNFYAQEDWVETKLDSAPPQINREHTQAWTQFDIGKGRTRDLSFRLQPITTKAGVDLWSVKPATSRDFLFLAPVSRTSKAPAQQDALAKAPIKQLAGSASKSPQSFQVPPGVKGNAVIVGRVLYDNGKPAAGLRIYAGSRLSGERRLWGYERNQSNYWKWPEEMDRLISGRAVTHADGTYRISGIMPERYNIIVVTKDRFWSHRPVGWLEPRRGPFVMASPGQATKAPNIVLRRAAIVKLKVVDQASGTPLEGIMISGFDLAPVETDGRSRTGPMDAHGKPRPDIEYAAQGITDKNGSCTLTLEAGKAYFYMSGGMRMTSIRQDNYKPAPNDFPQPMAVVTSNGLYKRDDWCEVVVGKGASRTAWKGETEVQLQKAQTLNVTMRLKKYAALRPHDKEFLNRKSSVTPKKS
jgi:protocatechuate 3,4-dioxygenase beta subunit